MASLTKNTIYLYALTASNYLFGLATIPYLTRILGPEYYGILGFAMAIGIYFNLIIDFGFILSGTRRVSLYANNKDYISEIFTSILIIKTFILGILVIGLYVISFWSVEVDDNLFLLYLYLILAYISSILPDYIYRGLEEMKIITIRGVLIRGIFTLLIFLFLKKPSQIFFVPLFQIVGSLIACIWIWYDINKRFFIRIKRVKFSTIYIIFRESIGYFLSRIASSIFNVTNTVILGVLYPGKEVVGFYSSVDKFRTLASQGCSPIADSFYPYMIRTKNYKRLFKVGGLMELGIIILMFPLYIWSEDICIFAFGEGYEGASVLLKWMIPVMVVTLPNYLLGFPALTPINKEKWANLSVELAMVCQIIGLIMLGLTDLISAVNLCVLTSISECVMLITRIIILYFSREKIRLQ